MAWASGLDGVVPTVAAVLHPVARLLFQVFYIADQPRYRGAMYLVALFCSAALIVLSIAHAAG